MVIDTGPLLLYLVGSYDKRYLSRFGYDEYEFLLLIRYLSRFIKIDNVRIPKNLCF